MQHAIRRSHAVRVLIKGAAALSVCVAGLIGLVAGAAPASAATTTLTNPTTVSGTQTLSSTGVTASGAGVTATFDLVTSAQWSQPAALGTAFDPSLVRQGQMLNPSDSYSRPGGPGTMTVNWTLSNLQVSWDGIGPLSLGSPGFSATGACALLAGGPDYSCNLTSGQISLLDTFPLPGPYVKLALGADVTVTPQGLATLRSTTFGGAPGPSAALSLGESPITDSLAIPCTVGAGADLNYALGPLSNTDAITVDTSLIFDVGLESPTPVTVYPEIDISFATPTIDLGSVSSTIALSGPGASFDMGSVLANNVPPVASAGGPYSGNEGSPITFDGSGSSSICGFPTLQWNFSDGGVAYGESPQHTFEGPGTYSGLLTATDATGLTSTTTFSVTVADLPPVTDAGASLSTEWGVPVTLNGSATDPGTAQQPYLSYGWNFGDGTGDSVGASVVHTYSTPGSYTPTFTACDPESLCASSSTAVTVTPRGTLLASSGATASDVTDGATFRASVVDDLGQAVVGRTVSFYADGAATAFASASTNAFGIASATYAFPIGSVGTHTIDAVFTGDAAYTGASSTFLFTVNRDPTNLSYSGASGAKPSHPALLSATLTDDAGRPLAGMSVSFTLGAQGCSAVTDATGLAQCSIAKLTQKSGTYVVVASYAGTVDYLAATASGGFTIG
jgi:PKD repeat protein